MIFTSNFANWRKFPKNYSTVSIANPPEGFKGQQAPELFPDKKALKDLKQGKITQEEFQELYISKLEKLNPEELWNKLQNTVLLCYEKYGDFCLRRIFAQWMESKGYTIPELGYLKVGVVGSRTFSNFELLKKVLDSIYNTFGISKIISGGANGADKLGELYAEAKGLQKEIFLPDWDKYGKSAGFIRNGLIVQNSDLIVAFWDGKSKGTLDTINKAKSKNKPTLIIKSV